MQERREAVRSHADRENEKELLVARFFMAASTNPPTRHATGGPFRFAIPPSWQLGDRLFALLCQAAALFVIAVSLALVVVLTWQAWLAIRTIGVSFFTTETWDPAHREFGALAFIYGTVATSAIAMLIAVPLGVGTAAFLSEIAPGWLRKTGAFLVEMLAAIPSVVYGFWGIFVLAPIMQSIFTALGGPNQGGVGILSAGIILSIMIVPYVAAVSFDVCQAVPDSQREASYALGATRWQTIWGAVLPFARPGIMGGCFLALGRALGETMAVKMLIGNVPVISLSPFAEGYSIPSVIANELNSAEYDLHGSALVELGLVLLAVSVVVNSLARLLIWRMGRRGKTGLFASVLGFLRPQVCQAAMSAPTAAAKAAVERASRIPHRVLGELAQPGRGNAVKNHLMTSVLALCLAITVGFLLFILTYLVFRGVGALNLAFFINLPKPADEPDGGMANALYGSFLLVGLASAFAVPSGILAAVYLAEYRSDRLGPVVRFIGEMLAGVPSIVIGVFAYYLLVKPMGHFSGWAGAFALGVMMIPIVMRATEEALRLVPASLRQASYALGASQWQTVLKVTLPAAFPAIITAVFLAIARVVGETAPLLLTTASNSFWPTSPNDEMPSLPYFIFKYSEGPSENWHRQGWAAALVLLTVVMVLSFGVRLITGRRAVATRQAG
jgi:phosphate transport system permease protein